MPLDVGRVTHLTDQMHRSEDDAGDPIDEGFLLGADGASGHTWYDPATLGGGGGGASPSGFLAIPLDPDYGDDFDGPLDTSRWTRVNVTSGEESFDDGYLDLSLLSSSAVRGYTQTPVSMPTNIEIILGPIQNIETATTIMFGPWFVDNTGAGVGFSQYHDGNAYTWNLAAGSGYTSTGNSVGMGAGMLYRIGLPYFLRLRKAGTSYFGSFSQGDRIWSPETSAVTFSGATKLGFGRMNNAVAQKVSIGRFNTV